MLEVWNEHSVISRYQSHWCGLDYLVSLFLKANKSGAWRKDQLVKNVLGRAVRGIKWEVFVQLISLSLTERWVV